MLLLITVICAAGCVAPETNKNSSGLVVDIRNAEGSFNAQAVAGLNRSSEEGVAVPRLYVANNDSEALFQNFSDYFFPEQQPEKSCRDAE
jgi:hypothetical protein